MNNSVTFGELGVGAGFVERLRERRIETPTDVQRLVIPRIREGGNVLFRSATGTGKTFAYLLPLIERVIREAEAGLGTEALTPAGSNRTALKPAALPSVLVVSPTLELCSQIKMEADFLLQGLPQKAALIIGSANLGRQIESLKKEKPDIVIGNIARLTQLEQMGKLKVRNVRAVVIDEGDRLVSDELFPATKAFFDNLFAGAVSGRDTSGGRSRREDGEGGGLPAGGAGQAQGRGGGRQIVACSATVAGKGRERLLGIMGAGAVFLETEEQELLRERISHWAFFSENRKKLDCLCSFLAASRAKKALVFTDNTSQIGNMAARLQYHKIAANGLCSDMDKAARKQAVADFRLGRIRVLVSSDLASRGLDIPDISHVISLDVPFDTDAYIHRAGRTARAGKKGIMTTIGNEEEMRRLALLEKKLGIAVYPKALYQGRIVAANEE